jgi:hypothetical protein
LKSINHAPSNNPADLVLLPPAGVCVPRAFRALETNDRLHSALLASAQRFRGEIYLQDGAVRPEQLTPDGRHDLPVDHESWHVLTLDQAGRTCACLRVHPEKAAKGFEGLPVSHSPLTRCPTWGSKLRRAVESEIERARKEHLHFGDVGGWAIAAERRRSVDSLRTILAGYSLMELLGGVVGIATATVKHGSAQILRKLGLRPLQANGNTIPAYYDPHYNSEMEVLRFDSRHPNPKYREWIRDLALHLAHARVVCTSQAQNIRPVTGWLLPDLWWQTRSLDAQGPAVNVRY